MHPTIGPYIISEHLGTGLTGKVKLGVHNETNDHVAIKIIKKSDFSERQNFQQKIQREIALMRLVDHPHILKLKDILESDRHLYIVEEYASRGELFDYLVARKSLNVDEALKFFREIIYGLEYLHQLGIIHRDLKPENLLIDEQLSIKIADFGFATFSINNNKIHETACGSPHYAAPEVLRGDPYDGKAADIWSCGVILYALIAGHLPFDDPNIRNLLSKVKRGTFQIPPSFPNIISDLINHMLALDPTQRYTIEQIKQHPAFRSGLPEGYILPRPLPIQAVPPMKMKDVEQPVLEVLCQLGFQNDDELASEIEAQPTTMAKVFVKMLSQKFDVVTLDWDQTMTPTFDPVEFQSEGILVDQDGDPYDYAETETLSFESRKAKRKAKRKADYVSSFERFSLAERPDWSTVVDTKPVIEEEQQIICDYLSGIEVMYAMQKLMAPFGLQWFYPDDTTIICRSKIEETYMIIHCQQGCDMIPTVLILQMAAGDNECFASICRAAEDTVQEELQNRGDEGDFVISI